MWRLKNLKFHIWLQYLSLHNAALERIWEKLEELERIRIAVSWKDVYGRMEIRFQWTSGPGDIRSPGLWWGQGCKAGVRGTRQCLVTCTHFNIKITKNSYTFQHWILRYFNTKITRIWEWPPFAQFACSLPCTLGPMERIFVN